MWIRKARPDSVLGVHTLRRDVPGPRSDLNAVCPRMHRRTVTGAAGGGSSAPSCGLLRRSIGASPCAVNRSMTLSGSSGRASVPARIGAVGTATEVDPGVLDASTGLIGPATWISSPAPDLLPAGPLPDLSSTRLRRFSGVGLHAVRLPNPAP